MGTVTLERVTRHDAEEERQRLLQRLGWTEEDLAERAYSYQLTEEELRVWRRVQALDWLLKG